MAIYTDLNEVASTKHCVFESSNLKSSIVGNIYDVIVRDAESKAIAIDNGMMVKVGAYTGDGLQTRYATKAGVKDKVAVVGTPALIKSAFTKAQEQPYNFYNEAGAVAKAYELVEEDIFAISASAIEGTVTVGAFVAVKADGTYEIKSEDPSATNGFVGKVHSISAGTYYDMVRIEVLQNTTIAEVSEA